MKFFALAPQLGLLAVGCFGALVKAVRDDVMILMYETDASLESDPSSPLHFFKQKGEIANLQTTVFGANLAYHGFGDKYQTLRPLLELVEEDKLVILADARDVALNVPDNEAFATLAVDNFLEAYKRLTKDTPHAVVMSAEAQCCVSAMSHAHPSEYFDPVEKKRVKRACPSGHPDCRWYYNKNIDDWQTFMEDLAFNKTGEENLDVYLNAGLMAGYPQDLINMLDIIDIGPSEDDQAVLSGFLYSFPELLVLDYKQELFGNNQWTRGLVDGCVFESQAADLPLVHTETGTEPLIIHTPGKFYGCLDILIEELGGSSQQRYLRGMDGRFFEDLMSGSGFNVLGRVSPPSIDFTVVESEESNYGDYGNYGYGNYGYGNYGYGNYGYGNYGYGNYGYGNYASGPESRMRRERNLNQRPFLGNMMHILNEFRNSFTTESRSETEAPTPTVPSDTDTPEEGAASNYGGYGNYGEYGNYGGYGVYGNYGAYGNYGYGNYGYGSYGNYGYGNYGNSGTEPSGRREMRHRQLQSTEA
ncbi:capsular polysaccharide biosynthesis protein [Nitzschia inconspicua]|uniref:Capsular polysaccharide biosynthesis protein n=1 Tax=Nitzschia inconspicua TaxID=303405 RepID=A0A9K3LKI3_9STRA|nr:capsular polysaccharide biosynthesis protein [Nitzschia inconspicua]